MSIRCRISVIIPTYRRCASVRRALEALAAQDFPRDEYEVVVVIDGSDDGTREMVAQFPASYRLQALWQPNGGRASACNAGIAVATGEVLILLDDDMTPIPGFLAAHERAHRDDPRLGVMGAVPIRYDQSSPFVSRYIGRKFNRHLENLARPDYRLTLRDFYSGNFSIRRDTLLSVGLFDDAFKIYGNEDIELSVRLTRAGVRLVYRAEALAYQAYTKDFAALARDNIAKGKTAVLLACKHPEIAGGLKLSTYRDGSRKWRMLRSVLLAASMRTPAIPDLVVGLVAWAERRRSPRLDEYYGLTLDYLFWFGVRSAQREDRAAARAAAGGRRAARQGR